jgi:DNA-binding transcriptional MerR regulator
MQTHYSIRDLEHLTGVKAHTLRIWESRYALMQPKRTKTNIRYYSDEDLRKILNVSTLVQMGWRISQVAALSDDSLAEEVLRAKAYEGDYKAEVRDLKDAMLRFDDDAFRRTMHHSISTYGFDATLQGVLRDFMEQLGFLWQTNTISILHEHFASSLIKQKLFQAIDQLPDKARPEAESVVLYLPSNELHELGLLYLNYWLRKKGFRVIYLGQSTPVKYVRELASLQKLDYAITVLTTQPEDDALRPYLLELIEIQEDFGTQFILTGFRLNNFNLNGEAGKICIMDGVEAIKNYMGSKVLV